jgi:hypothetical protein
LSAYVGWCNARKNVHGVRHRKLRSLLCNVTVFFVPLVFANDIFYLIFKIRGRLWLMEFRLLTPTI